MRIWALAVLFLTAMLGMHFAYAQYSGWKYEAFPIIKNGQKLKFPLSVTLPSETLNASIHPKLGTHPYFGVDQIYTSKKFSRRILIKQGVKISNNKLVGRWLELEKNKYVYHYPVRSTLVALYVQNFNERERNLIEKQFVPKKVRHKFSVLWSLPPVDCAVAELSTGTGFGGGQLSGSGASGSWGAGGGAAGSAEADAGQGMVACLANKSRDQLVGQAQAVGDMASSAYDATASALEYAYNDPMGAASETFGFLYRMGRGAVSGVYSGVKATAQAGYRVVTDPRQVWEDVNASLDRMEEFGRNLYAQAEEAIQGFNDLDPAVRNRLICEFGGVIIAEGLVGAALGLTGAGAAAAGVKFARMLNNFRDKVQKLMPGLRVLAQSNLSAREKQRLVSQLFNDEISLAEFQQQLSGVRGGAIAGKTADARAGTPVAGSAGVASGRATTAATLTPDEIRYLDNLYAEDTFGKVRVMNPEDITLLSRADDASKITVSIDDDIITGTRSEILERIKGTSNPRRVRVEGIQGQGASALAGRPGLAKITDGQSTRGLGAFENVSDDTAMNVTVMLRNGESASFRGNKQMIVDLAETSGVESVIVHTPPSWVQPLHKLSDADLSRAPGAAGLVGSNPALTTTTQANGLAGMRVHHGTIEGMTDSVRAGPKNVGSGFGGRGLYLDLEPDARIADSYASMARDAAQARTRTAGVSTSNVNPVVMTGRLNPNKNLRVFSFEVSRDATRPDFQKGILPINWADDPSIARYIESQFDVVEVRGARSGGLNMDTDRFIVVHERAGADAIIWESVSPAK